MAGGMMCAPVRLTGVARADIRAVDVGLGAVEFQLALAADILGGEVPPWLEAFRHKHFLAP
jgi:hypothetical protein